MVKLWPQSQHASGLFAILRERWSDVKPEELLRCSVQDVPSDVEHNLVVDFLLVVIHVRLNNLVYAFFGVEGCGVLPVFGVLLQVRELVSGLFW